MYGTCYGNPFTGGWQRERHYSSRSSSGSPVAFIIMIILRQNYSTWCFLDATPLTVPSNMSWYGRSARMGGCGNRIHILRINGSLSITVWKNIVKIRCHHVCRTSWSCRRNRHRVGNTFRRDHYGRTSLRWHWSHSTYHRQRKTTITGIVSVVISKFYTSTERSHLQFSTPDS